MEKHGSGVDRGARVFACGDGGVSTLSSDSFKLKPVGKEGSHCFLVSFTVSEGKEQPDYTESSELGGICCLISICGGWGVTMLTKVCFISAAREKDFPDLSRGHQHGLLDALFSLTRGWREFLAPPLSRQSS